MEHAHATRKDNLIFNISKQYQKNFKCQHCGKLFKQKSNLNTHVRIHTGERPYSCKFPNCKKRFATLGNLKAHESIHSGQKLFKCAYQNCKKQYYLDYRLQIHLRTHFNYKPFHCDFCGRKFNEKGNLKIHMRIHTGEKPFVCAVEGCGRKLRTLGHLLEHKRHHKKCNGNKPQKESERMMQVNAAEEKPKVEEKGVTEDQDLERTLTEHGIRTLDERIPEDNATIEESLRHELSEISSNRLALIQEEKNLDEWFKESLHSSLKLLCYGNNNSPFNGN